MIQSRPTDLRVPALEIPKLIRCAMASGIWLVQAEYAAHSKEKKNKDLEAGGPGAKRFRVRK
jgi:hypothetical protein